MTRRAAVIGHPVGHSLSPVLHSAAYRALGLDWRYDAIDVTEPNAAEFVTSRGPEWAGLSVTAPLKHAVRAALDEESALATRVGAVNTVVFTDGRVAGHNTDVLGIVRALGEAQVPEGLPMSLIGAGGTAAAALAAGEAGHAPSIRICARRDEAVADLVARIPVAGAEPVAWEARAEALEAPVVVVTLPGDAAAGLAELIPDAPGVLLDVTYHPWPTTLARAWRERGGTVISGHRMLLWQAVAQVQLMTGQEPPVAAMAEALERALATRENVD